MNTTDMLQTLIVSSALLCSLPVDARFDPGTPTALTGVYRGDDDGMYYVRVLNDGRFFWFGEHPDGRFANVFYGRLETFEDRSTFSGYVNGGWLDVPKGLARRGSLRSSDGGLAPFGIKLRLDRPQVNEMQKVAGTGTSFGATRWVPSSGIAAPRVIGYGATPGDTTLTGIWIGNDGGTYYVRQAGPSVTWFGSGCSNTHMSGFANVFAGTLSENTISGQWADVPYGNTNGTGALTLNFSGRSLTQTAPLAGFGATSWTPVANLLNTPVSSLNVIIKTGADDLRARSIVNGRLVLGGGTTAASGELQTSAGFAPRSQHSVHQRVRSGTTLGALRSASYVLTHDGSPRSFPDAHDQWDVAEVQITATLSTGQTVCLLQSFNSFRLNDSKRTQTLRLPSQ